MSPFSLVNIRQSAGAAALALVLGGQAMFAWAGSHDSHPGATVEELLQLLDPNNPQLAAFAGEAEAAAARVQPAGALADPTLRIEWEDLDRERPDPLSDKGVTKYTVIQPLPWAGKRELRRQVATSQLAEAQARMRESRAELRSRIKTEFARYYEAARSRALTLEIANLVADLEQIARLRYATGLAPQQDAIRAQVEATDLKSSLIDLETEMHHAAARINAVLARPGHAALAEPKALPALPRVSAVEMARLEERVRSGSPALAARRAGTAAAKDTAVLVERNRYPDLAVGVSFVQRRAERDALEAMLELNIPLQQETRRSQEREAAAMVAAARAREDAAANQVLGEFREILVALEAAQRREALIRDNLQPQAEVTYQSALAGYQTGKVDFGTLIDAQRQIRRARLDLLKAQVEQRVRVAELERLLGEDL